MIQQIILIQFHRFFLIPLLFFVWETAGFTQESLSYDGTVIANPDYHHGQLRLAIGVHNIQVVRANRELPDKADSVGWTYNHAPHLAHWNDNFYLHYTSFPFGENVPPGQIMLVTSEDGYRWSEPRVLFAPYRIPAGTSKPGQAGATEYDYAAVHQRMGFYVSSDNRLLATGYYGICLFEGDSPADGDGIGRVVREIYPDRSFGPVYFIRYNSGWTADNTSYPYFRSSGDKDFVIACEELLGNPLLTQQWADEADRDDPLTTLEDFIHAMSYYQLEDGRFAGIGKLAQNSVSNDGGRSWSSQVKAPGFVTKMSKVWGQKTSDGKYAVVYNPTEHSPGGLYVVNIQYEQRGHMDCPRAGSHPPRG